ncbi:phage tail termination protein [[Kitasatospora] papulosa]|uniref:phage tail termination protein n=1 Tax=[Kitasatospora] papulosa TaxID=1464011 RepID=UPI00369B3F2B
MWADIELAVITGLDTRLQAGVRVTDELPDRLETKLPLVWVQAAGGADDRVTDTATVDVHVFAATRAETWDLTELVRTAMHALAATHVPGQKAVIDDVATDQRPALVPYGNPALRRSVATYTVATRERAAP